MSKFTRRSFGALLASGAATSLLGLPKSALALDTPVKGGLLRLVSGVEPPILIEILQTLAVPGLAGAWSRVY